MHLADAAEVRVQQQTDANTKLQFQDFPSRPATVNDSGERYDALCLYNVQQFLYSTLPVHLKWRL